VSAFPSQVDEFEYSSRGMSTIPALGRRRRLSWPVRILLFVLGVVVVYVVALNVFLGTHLFRNMVNADPSALLVDYDAASSFLPGHVHARNLSIRGRDSRIEWLLTVDEVDFKVALRELLDRRFHPLKVRGRGVRMLLRQRIDRADATPAVLAALPRIPGFDEIPLKDAVAAPPVTDANYNYWSIRLDDVVADGVKELWIDQGRFTGDALVAGTLDLRPARWVAVGPASLQVRAGEVRVGDAVVAGRLTGTMDCMIHGFDPRAPQGLPILKQATTTARFDGVIPSLAFLDRALATEGARAEGGGGTAHVELAFDKGRFGNGTQIQIESKGAKLSAPPNVIEASAVTKVGVSNGEARLEITLSPLAMTRTGVEAAMVRARDVKVDVRSRGLDVEHLLAEPSIVIDVPDAVVPDVRLFDAYLAPGGPVRLSGGRGEAHGHVEITGGSAKGTAAIELRGTEARAFDTDVRGDITTALNLASGSLAGDLDVSGTRLDLANVTTSAGGSAWAGRVDLQSARLRVGPSPSFAGRAAMTGRDARPLLAVLLGDTKLPSWTSGLVSLDGLKGSAQVTADGSKVELRELRAKAGGFTVSADYTKRGERARTLMLVARGGMTVGVDSAGTHVVQSDAKRWFTKAEADFVKPDGAKLESAKPEGAKR
jgi:hypothetical protein